MQLPNLQLKAKIEAVKALPWKRWLVYALIGLGVLAALAFAYNRFWPRPVVVSKPQVAPEAKRAVNVPQIVVAGPKKMTVYKKEELFKKLPMPAGVQADPKNEFTASAELPVAPYGGTAVSFTNMSTGQSAIVVTPKERPLFGFGGKIGIGLIGGVSTKGNVAVGYASQNIIRIGPVNIGVAGGSGMIGTDFIIGGGIHVNGTF